MKLLTATFSDAATLNVALRLTLASMSAMAAATALSLQNPWWAAMAVWMVGQPPRGLLLERSLAQLLGCILGASVGVALVQPWPGTPATPLLGLAAWLAICCGVANLMRHQRAYGAAVGGLTAAVVVSLTLGTVIDPVSFATARVVDTAIGIASAFAVATLLGPSSATSFITVRAKMVTLQALALITQAMSETATHLQTQARGYLLSLASLEASAEDAAAGSLSARRKLRELHALLAYLLDLLVVARAIHSREASLNAPGHEKMAILKAAFDKSAADLDAHGKLDVQDIIAASQRLEKGDPVLSPVLDEMRTLLLRAADGYSQVVAKASEHAKHWSIPHPDFSAVRLAVLRGGVVASMVGLAWLMIGWDPLRYLVLGAGIFTVLFSAMDEPARVVRQVLVAGIGASAAAVLWRVAVIPDVGNAWLSLALAFPLVFGASLLQARQGTVFIGLAFNMLFAVLARPVDVGPTSALGLVAIEAMLLCGIAVAYGFYRWFLPMNTQRRRKHLRASVRKEISAISIRAGTPWAGRHLARVRYLVFRIAARSGGDVREVEDALAALSLAHAFFRLGEMAHAPALGEEDRRIILQTLDLMASPMANPHRAEAMLRQHAAKIGNAATSGATGAAAQSTTIRWLLEMAADNMKQHPTLFA
ncbi:FUSC family protein [Blastomonas sp. RAC04]|uniref:FUSC family protein n=1 Tax=Blastomonas sp. RAC04 TaxID=1842535 RepID=UPI001F2C5967|nr:FUSC family protein [Blastomonas sp. RAC04]